MIDPWRTHLLWCVVFNCGWCVVMMRQVSVQLFDWDLVGRDYCGNLFLSLETEEASVYFVSL